MYQAYIQLNALFCFGIFVIEDLNYLDACYNVFKLRNNYHLC
jgi:hypothetical protein